MIRTEFTDLIMPTYRRWMVEIVSGVGATVIDADGREYLDLLGGIAVCSVGHCHPHVVEAIRTQAGKLIHISNLYETGPQRVLANRLSALTSGKLSFFCNSGAEAIECALKLARKHGKPHGRYKIVSANGSFHGRTFGALSATGQPSKREAFEPTVPGFVHVEYGDADALSNALDGEVAAVLLEPIQGEAGVVVPPAGYLGAARQLCDDAGALLILDEIQTGLGRTGTWWCYEHEEIEPDIVCIAKALAGGLPMGACLASQEVAESFAPGDHATTFGGGPVQSAAALATLDVIENEGLVDRSAILGERLHGWLMEAFPGCEVRGRGFLMGVDLGVPLARAVAEQALEEGLLVNDATSDVLRLAPPLIIDEEELERAVWVLGEVFDAARQA